MIFNPENLTCKDECFYFDNKVTAVANSCINKDIIKEFWFGHTYHLSNLEIIKAEEMVFKTGDAEPISLDDYLYTVNVTKDGIAINANSQQGLLNAYMTLIDRIKIDDENKLYIECFSLKEKPIINTRMVHFCIFPETELYELERFVRLCGCIKYTHIVLEFWGMLEFDCLKELSWKHGFKKDEIKPIIQIASDLGVEIIPMFNHWGHASMSRCVHGKHVVLDQNPSLQSYFSEDGWRWNIYNENTKTLLKNIRKELMELCGNGSYFHIGCDEAYGFKKEEAADVCKYINEINDDINSFGRKTIMWGDMMICYDERFNSEKGYVANATDLECEQFFLSNINKNIIIADWQYWVKKSPVISSVILKEAGFDVLLCPWDIGNDESDSCIDTIKENNLLGLIHTTWHTLCTGTFHVVRNAVACWEKDYKNTKTMVYVTRTASLQRKVYFTDGDYKKSGWSKIEIPAK